VVTVSGPGDPYQIPLEANFTPPVCWEGTEYHQPRLQRGRLPTQGNENNAMQRWFLLLQPALNAMMQMASCAWPIKAPSTAPTPSVTLLSFGELKATNCRESELELCEAWPKYPYLEPADPCSRSPNWTDKSLNPGRGSSGWLGVACWAGEVLSRGLWVSNYTAQLSAFPHS
jgi:hypothetical protein